MTGADRRAMEMKVVDARQTKRLLARCIEEHDEIHWAVAWARWNDTAKLLLRRRAKFRTVIFGVSFSQTDPDLIEALIGVRNAYVASRFSGGTFHPKVYCFRSGRHAAAIVGSANFTNGGLGPNLEGSIFLAGEADSLIFRQLFGFVRASLEHCEAVTEQFSHAYRLSHERAARLPKAPRNPFSAEEGPSLKSAVSPMASMSWSQFAADVARSSNHDVSKSIELLRIAQGWFSSVPSFGNLSPQQRKALAGTLGDYEKRGPELNREWGWFGSMRGAGDFANRVEQGDVHLARAVDSIPRQGEVTRSHYDRFIASFRRAFDHSHRVGRVATASRLLAMKRPDTFLCVCGPNIDRASRAMGFPKTTLSLDNYWDRIVEAIRISHWYNSDRPANPEAAELWDFRAAMLDAIYYVPPRK